MKEITSTFSRISSSIRDLIAELEVINTKESLYIADLFLRIQELEKRKLQGVGYGYDSIEYHRVPFSDVNLPS